MKLYWAISSTIMILSLIGLLMLNSIAPRLAVHQLTFLLLGWTMFFFISNQNFSFWRRFGAPGYAFLNLGLASVVLIGQATKGSTRWLDVGGFFHFQPSQLMVPLAGLFLANFLTRFDINDYFNLFKYYLFILLPSFLVIIEPDLSTTLIFLLVVHSLLFFSSLKIYRLGQMALFSFFALVVIFLFLLKPYQRQRLQSFLLPVAGSSQATTDENYNARQALIAVGSGQFLGRGLGQGVQSQLRFLPEKHTDFIFAAIAEELGFVGASLILFLYLLLFVLLLFYINQVADRAARLYGWGMLTFLITQTTINIAMNIGLLPITGLTLPFVSYGGSSLVANLIGLALLLSSPIRKKGRFFS